MVQVFEEDSARDAFLDTPRLAILMTNRAGQAPMGVPVWYEWSGAEVLMFTARNARKLQRLRADPRAMVLVTNHVGEAEAWVSFEGTVAICEDEDAWPLVTRIAPKYWDVDAKRDTLAAWEAAKDQFVLLRLAPDHIRSGQ